MNLILTGASSTAGAGGSTILMLVLMFAVFYFFFIRPENKKKKKVEDMRNSLSLGDEITTIGGMTGKIVQVTEDTVTFETGEDRVRIQIKKWGISTTAKMEAAEAEARSSKGGLPQRQMCHRPVFEKLIRPHEDDQQCNAPYHKP